MRYLVAVLCLAACSAGGAPRSLTEEPGAGGAGGTAGETAAGEAGAPLDAGTGGDAGMPAGGSGGAQAGAPGGLGGASGGPAKAGAGGGGATAAAGSAGQSAGDGGDGGGGGDIPPKPEHCVAGEPLASHGFGQGCIPGGVPGAVVGDACGSECGTPPTAYSCTPDDSPPQQAGVCWRATKGGIVCCETAACLLQGKCPDGRDYVVCPAALSPAQTDCEVYSGTTSPDLYCCGPKP